MGETGEQGSVWAAADRNMAEAWTAIVASAPDPRSSEEDGVYRFSSGIPFSLFNQAHVTAPPRDPAATVAAVAEHFGALGLPYCLYFRDEVAPGLADAAAAAGLLEHWQPALQVLDPIGPPTEPAPEGFEVVTVDEGNLTTYGEVLARGFGIPMPVVPLLFGPALLAAEGFTGFLGLFDGEPVASSATYRSHGLTGIYNVATVPEAQRRGFGAAVTWAAVQAGAAAGDTTAILQASKAGEPIYARMGFTTPDRYRQFEPPA